MSLRKSNQGSGYSISEISLSEPEITTESNLFQSDEKSPIDISSTKFDRNFFSVWILSLFLYALMRRVCLLFHMVNLKRLT